jgi:indolepyruvate ferredoxin oxidoreductase alpha subunit
VCFEALAHSLGIGNVHVIDPIAAPDRLEEVLRASLASNELTVIITRRPCLLAAGRIKQYEANAACKMQSAE